MALQFGKFYYRAMLCISVTRPVFCRNG